jgi:hypothetical protein
MSDPAEPPSGAMTVSVLDATLARLRAAGVSSPLRKPVSPGDGPPHELDIWLDPTDVPRADEVLATSGFLRVRVGGHAPHRFYVGFSGGVWHKIDAKLSGRRSTPQRVRRILRRAPAGLRRFGPMIAVVGGDGVVRSRSIEQLRCAIPLGVHVLDVGRAGPLGRALAPVRAYARAWSGAIVLCLGPPGEYGLIRPDAVIAARAGGSADRLLTDISGEVFGTLASRLGRASPGRGRRPLRSDG